MDGLSWGHSISQGPERHLSHQQKRNGLPTRSLHGMCQGDFRFYMDSNAEMRKKIESPAALDRDSGGFRNLRNELCASPKGLRKPLKWDTACFSCSEVANPGSALERLNSWKQKPFLAGYWPLRREKRLHPTSSLNQRGSLSKCHGFMLRGWFHPSQSCSKPRISGTTQASTASLTLCPPPGTSARNWSPGGLSAKEEIWVSYNDLTRPNSPQMVVYLGNGPPTTLFQVGEILQFTQKRLRREKLSGTLFAVAMAARSNWARFEQLSQNQHWARKGE